MTSVMRSLVIEAPVHRVWARIRDFNALPEWTAVVADSELEEGRSGDAVGAVRKFRLNDGAQLRERLLALSDRDHRIEYSILESPMPLSNYVAELWLVPITAIGGTLACWKADFRCAELDREELITSIGDDVFLASLEKLKAQLEQNADPAD